MLFHLLGAAYLCEKAAEAGSPVEKKYAREKNGEFNKRRNSKAIKARKVGVREIETSESKSG